ncbi:hypothetical protein C2E23DRAFT_5095 [Lenzites betulinus]|nr:hypothetical protein C2E23DRAFT_5095 [Lenzites betulinus]
MRGDGAAGALFAPRGLRVRLAGGAGNAVSPSSASLRFRLPPPPRLLRGLGFLAGASPVAGFPVPFGAPFGCGSTSAVSRSRVFWLGRCVRDVERPFASLSRWSSGSSMFSDEPGKPNCPGSSAGRDCASAPSGWYSGNNGTLRCADARRAGMDIGGDTRSASDEGRRDCGFSYGGVPRLRSASGTCTCFPLRETIGSGGRLKDPCWLAATTMWRKRTFGRIGGRGTGCL